MLSFNETEEGLKSDESLSFSFLIYLFLPVSGESLQPAQEHNFSSLEDISPLLNHTLKHWSDKFD